MGGVGARSSAISNEIPLPTSLLRSANDGRTAARSVSAGAKGPGIPHTHPSFAPRVGVGSASVLSSSVRGPWAEEPLGCVSRTRGFTASSDNHPLQVVAFLGFAPGCFDRVRLLVWRQRPGGEFGWGGISVRPQRRCPKQGSVRTGIARGAQGQTALLTTRSSVTILAVKAWPCDPSVPHPKCSRF